MINKTILSQEDFEAELPFDSLLISLPFDKIQSDLPFWVGGATQQGTMHIMDGYNNQDSFNVVIEDSFIAAIVCDGCSSSDDASKNLYSHNEVGAKLYALLFSRGVRKIYSEILEEDPYFSLLKDKDLQKFLRKLTSFIYQRMKKFIKVIGYESPEEARRIIFDFFMTTAVGFLVTEKEYIVFHWGDGIAIVNDEKISFDKFSGDYFADLHLQYFLKPRSSALKFRLFKKGKTGRTEDLNTLFIATDGLETLLKQYEHDFIQLIQEREARSRKKNSNLDYPIQDIRKFFIE